ncbi:MAG: 5'/3'-nucleotidase SurE [Acidimicrobiia bacterium]|nr:5'/3'-nucleotidase SurE [Acidimicrobiia bacterium]
MRIMVTNDDGIDSVGLHVLARAMRAHGDVTIVAPDKEYSGAGAAVGALHQIQPEVHETRVDGIDVSWAVSGPPALCVMFAGLGAFGDPFDLIVSGINPGSNVGRSVYHSGTVGAALTGRLRGISGVAVSQAVDDWGVEGQGWDDVLDKQCWDSAAEIASTVVGGLVASPPLEPVVINLNVPNRPVAEIAGWRLAQVGSGPPRSMASVDLEPKAGHAGSYRVQMSWGEPMPLDPATDGGSIMDNRVAVSWLSHLTHQEPIGDGGIIAALDQLFG